MKYNILVWQIPKRCFDLNLYTCILNFFASSFLLIVNATIKEQRNFYKSFVKIGKIYLINLDLALPL